MANNENIAMYNKYCVMMSPYKFQKMVVHNYEKYYCFTLASLPNQYSIVARLYTARNTFYIHTSNPCATHAVFIIRGFSWPLTLQIPLSTWVAMY